MNQIVLNPPVVMNGVNVTALGETIDAVNGNADIAKFNFRLSNSWIDGDRNRSVIQDFTGALAEHRTDARAFVCEAGEPAVLLGQDQSPNPAEWLLHALVGCMTTSTAYHCAARGIEVEAIDTRIDGDIDLRGFLGLSQDVRKGFSVINAHMRVKTKADAATIKAITDFSPIKDVVARSVPVNLTVETY